MQEIRIGSAWTPVQSGIKLATSSILSLHRRLAVDEVFLKEYQSHLLRS